MVQTSIAYCSPVFRRCATSHFVHNHKRSRSGLLENRGSLQHFDHESRLVSKKIVSSPYAAKDLINNPNLRILRRNIRANLRKDCNQRVLSQERAFATHVRPSDQPDSFLLAKKEVIADKGSALLL